MKIIAIKDMSARNGSVGEMWQETKVFHHEDSLIDVMKWVNSQKKRVTLTIPDNYDFDEIEAAMRGLIEKDGK